MIWGTGHCSVYWRKTQQLPTKIENQNYISEQEVGPKAISASQQSLFTAYQTRVAATIFGIATRCTVILCTKCDVTWTCHCGRFPVGHSKYLRDCDKGDTINFKPKHAKNNEADQTQGEQGVRDKRCSQWEGCAGYKKFLVFWKVRQCTTHGVMHKILPRFHHWLQRNGHVKLCVLSFSFWARQSLSNVREKGPRSFPFFQRAT